MIYTIVIKEKNIGQKIFIPIMNLMPYDSILHFKSQRRQILVALCFAMTINKS